MDTATIAFVVVGVALGITAAFFVYCCLSVQSERRKNKDRQIAVEEKTETTQTNLEDDRSETAGNPQLPEGDLRQCTLHDLENEGLSPDDATLAPRQSRKEAENLKRASSMSRPVMPLFHSQARQLSPMRHPHSTSGAAVSKSQVVAVQSYPVLSSVLPQEPVAVRLSGDGKVQIPKPWKVHLLSERPSPSRPTLLVRSQPK